MTLFHMVRSEKTGIPPVFIVMDGHWNILNNHSDHWGSTSIFRFHEGISQWFIVDLPWFTYMVTLPIKNAWSTLRFTIYSWFMLIYLWKMGGFPHGKWISMGGSWLKKWVGFSMVIRSEVHAQWCLHPGGSAESVGTHAMDIATHQTCAPRHPTTSDPLFFWGGPSWLRIETAGIQMDLDGFLWPKLVDFLGRFLINSWLKLVVFWRFSPSLWPEAVDFGGKSQSMAI